MKLQPLFDAVVIEPVTRVGHLHIPDSARGGGLQRGMVVAIGDGVRKVKVGDEVFFGVRARGAFAELVSFEGRDLVICPAEAILARVVHGPMEELDRLVPALAELPDGA